VSTFARKYARGERGLIRSCRVHPAARSVAIRAPLESIAALAAEQRVAPPALLIVGDVAGFAPAEALSSIAGAGAVSAGAIA